MLCTYRKTAEAVERDWRKQEYEVKHEIVQHGMDTQRGHCRPRRHGENPARVVVAVHGGDDAALGKVTDGSTVTDWDEEEIARKISINTGLAYAEWQAPGQSGKDKNQFPRYAGLFHFHQRNEVVADRGRRRADRGGRGERRAGGDGKGVGLRDGIRAAARVRAELDGPRTGELRARARIAAAGVWARRGAGAIADRRRRRDFAA